VALPLVHRVTIELPRLPHSFSGMTVAVVADLHGRKRGADFAAWLVRQVNELRADLTVLLGDMVHHPMHGPEVLPFLSGLKARHGVWACLGNHEYGCVWFSRHAGGRRHPPVEEWRLMYSDAGVRLLANEAVPISEGTERIWLAGIDDAYSGRADVQSALEGVDRDECILAITHSPDVVDADGVQAIDLVLAGHTHGGQIRIPGIGPLWAPCRHPRKRASGLVTGERTRLFVVRGVGEGTPIRICCPREIGLVELVRPRSESGA
jgi:predicted MPP superfamily phosphohydrolase